MARIITCVCGEHHKVTKWKAGTKRRCEECKRLITFPPLVEADRLDVVDEDEPERLEVVDEDEPEEEDRRRRVGKPTEGKRGICFLCEEEDRGRFVTFYAGVLVRSWSEHDP